MGAASHFLYYYCRWHVLEAGRDQALYRGCRANVRTSTPLQFPLESHGDGVFPEPCVSVAACLLPVSKRHQAHGGILGGSLARQSPFRASNVGCDLVIIRANY